MSTTCAGLSCFSVYHRVEGPTRWVASGHSDGTVRLTNVLTGNVVQEYPSASEGELTRVGLFDEISGPLLRGQRSTPSSIPCAHVGMFLVSRCVLVSCEIRGPLSSDQSGKFACTLACEGWHVRWHVPSHAPHTRLMRTHSSTSACRCRRAARPLLTRAPGCSGNC